MSKCSALDMLKNHFETKKKNKWHKMSIHEGIRYQCDQCDYKATQKRDLKTHRMSVHEGIKY